MKHPDPKLFTPIYIKSEPEEPLPADDSAYYVLSSAGLFLCRNHPFFTSSVRVDNGPSELAAHREAVSLRYPKIPQKQLELIVGFFAHMGEAHGAEAAAILLWDATAKRMRFRVPPQRASVTESWSGRHYPSDLHYDMPVNLPAHLSVVGDIHSHVDAPAYASATDQLDETHRPGIHLVVGKIYREPPELHCEFVVDGVRFEVHPTAVIEGYERRNMRFRREWIDRVEVDVQRSYANDTHAWNTGSGRSWDSSNSRAWDESSSSSWGTGRGDSWDTKGNGRSDAHAGSTHADTYTDDENATDARGGGSTS